MLEKYFSQFTNRMKKGVIFAANLNKSINECKFNNSEISEYGAGSGNTQNTVGCVSTPYSVFLFTNTKKPTKMQLFKRWKSSTANNPDCTSDILKIASIWHKYESLSQKSVDIDLIHHCAELSKGINTCINNIHSIGERNCNG